MRTIRGGPARGLRMNLDLQSQSQRYVGLDEYEVASDLRRLVRCCRSCVDVGANDGYYTLIFLNSCAEQVIACEPGPSWERLLHNAEANNYFPGERLRIEKRLVGTADGQVTVRELVVKLPGPVLLKVDIDGGERDLLESAADSSRLADLYWIIETHSAKLEQECKSWLEAHGYSTKIIANAWWRCFVPETRPGEQNRWLIAEPVVHD